MNKRAIGVLIVILGVMALIYVGVTMRRSSENQIGVGHDTPDEQPIGPVSREGQRRAAGQPASDPRPDGR